MTKDSSTVGMRRLGAQLRKIREDRGLTLDEAANLFKLSKSSMNRMENAQAVVRRHETEHPLIKYEVTDQDLCYWVAQPSARQARHFPQSPA